MIASECAKRLTNNTRIYVVEDSDTCEQICRHCNQTCSRITYCDDYYSDTDVFVYITLQKNYEDIFKEFYIINDKEEIFTLKYQLKNPVKIVNSPFLKRYRMDRLIGKREKRIGLKR